MASGKRRGPHPATPAPEAGPVKHTARTKVPPKAERSRQLATDSPTTAAAAPTAAPAPPPPPQPVTVTVPANTILTVRTIDSIDSKTNHAGEGFKASLDAPILADDKVIVPARPDAYIKPGSGSSAGRITGRTEPRLEVTSIVCQRKTY